MSTQSPRFARAGRGTDDDLACLRCFRGRHGGQRRGRARRLCTRPAAGRAAPDADPRHRHRRPRAGDAADRSSFRGRGEFGGADWGGGLSRTGPDRAGSLLLGGIAGSLLDIEARLEGFGDWLRTRLGRRRRQVPEGVPRNETPSGHDSAGTLPSGSPPPKMPRASASSRGSSPPRWSSAWAR